MKKWKWSPDEVKFLVENYSEHGPSWVAQQLDRGIYACKEKAERLGVKFDRSEERTYLRSLAAIQADIAEHGKPSTLRIVEASGIARSTINKTLWEARKRGEVAPSPISAKMIERVKQAEIWGVEDDLEPTEEEVAEVQQRWAIERARKDEQISCPRWSVPVVVCLI